MGRKEICNEEEGVKRLQEMEDRYRRSLTPSEKRKRELVSSLQGLYSRDHVHQTMNWNMDGYDEYLEKLMNEEHALELELHELLEHEISERGEGE